MGNRIKHSVNGKFLGMFYETDSGRRLYLAHRSAGDVYRKRNAWCIETALLDKCRREGYPVIGVVRRVGRQRLVWLTLVEDFFDSPYSFPHFKDVRHRGLPLSQFRIDPTRSAEVIETAVRMR